MGERVMDSNSVTITGSMISNIAFVTGSVVVTPGQSASTTVSVGQDGSEWTLVLLANREGSSTVANEFNAACGGSQHEYCPTASFDTSPGALNFFFGVTITVNVPNVGQVQLPELYLAQGHVGFNNNWWIGGNAINTTQNVSDLVVVYNNQVVMQIQLSGGVSNFNFTT
jgi:hypothetical protein